LHKCYKNIPLNKLRTRVYTSNALKMSWI